MAYTLREVTLELFAIANNNPHFVITKKTRKQGFEIKYKPKCRYLSGKECFKHLKFLYETMYLKKINWDYLNYIIEDKHIFISNI